MTREEAIERLNIHKSTSVFVDSIAEAIDMAIEALQADAVPHGRWEKVVKGSKYKICTNCMKKQWLPSPKWNYCPHCGAKIGGGNND